MYNFSGPDGLRLRPIEEYDALLVATWRNLPEARAAFFSGDVVVTPDSHVEFCRNRQPHDLVWMAGIGGREMGMVSLTVDVESKTAQFGRLLVAPEYAGKGMAEKITRLAMRFGFEVLRLDSLWLHVKQGNTKALELYDRTGWLIVDARHPLGKMAIYNIIEMVYLSEDWNRV